MLSILVMLIGFALLQRKEEAARDRLRIRSRKTRATSEKGKRQPRPAKIARKMANRLIKRWPP